MKIFGLKAIDREARKDFAKRRIENFGIRNSDCGLKAVDHKECFMKGHFGKRGFLTSFGMTGHLFKREEETAIRTRIYFKSESFLRIAVSSLLA